MPKIKDPFHNVYLCLLGKHIGFTDGGHIALLDLLRHVRNLIHNNGVYFHKTKPTDSVTWRGKTYHLREGVKVGISWELMANVAAGLGKLLVDVVLHPKLEAYTEVIQDPISFVGMELWT